jgi:branched-chain amino acid transport system permease protein
MILLLAKYTLHSAAVLCLVAIALRLRQGLNRFYDFSVAAYFTLSPFVCQVLAEQFRVGVLWSVVLSLLVVGLAGLLFEVVVFRTLRERKARTDVAMLVSIALCVMLLNVIAATWGSDTRYFTKALVWKSETGGVTLLSQLTVAMLVCWAAVSIAVSVWLARTGWGKAFRAASSSPELARICGIRVEVMCGLVAVEAAVIAGLAGILAGADNSITHTMGLEAVLGGLAVAIIAGEMSVIRLAITALSMGAVFCAVGYLLRAEWRDAVAFALLLTWIGARGAWRVAVDSGRSWRTAEQ